MIIILTRSLCLVGCCGSFRWVRGSCLLVFKSFCASNLFLWLSNCRRSSPKLCLWITVQVWGNKKVCVLSFVVLCWCVCDWRRKRAYLKLWFHVLLAEELHSSLGILDLKTMLIILKYSSPEHLQQRFLTNTHRRSVVYLLGFGCWFWVHSASRSRFGAQQPDHFKIKAVMSLKQQSFQHWGTLLSRALTCTHATSPSLKAPESVTEDNKNAFKLCILCTTFGHFAFV